MASPTSFVQIHSDMSMQGRGWFPPLVLAALLSLSVASVIGTALTGVVFGSMDDLRKQGRGIAQCFVFFSSLLSLLYVVLHLLAARKGNRLYLNFDPPIPSFKHQLHAWAIVVIRLAVLMWSTACITVAVGIHHGGGGHKTARLDVDMFACSVGFVFGCLILCVAQTANRPFDLPWITPSDFKSDIPGIGEVDEKSNRSLDTSSSKGRTILTAIGHQPSMPSDLSSSNMSGSTSSSKTKARRIFRTRRYVLEAPSPMVMMPVKPPNFEPSDEAQTRSSQQFEETLVPRASQSESYFTAAGTGPPVQPVPSLAQTILTKPPERPASPATVIYVGDNKFGPGMPQHPPKAADVKKAQRYSANRREPGNLSTARLHGKPPIQDLQTTKPCATSQIPSVPDATLPSSPPPPPPPAPTSGPAVDRLTNSYNIPGAWTQRISYGGEGGYI